jgi:hypothetical protein
MRAEPLDPPFLELAYYVGSASVSRAVELLAGVRDGSPPKKMLFPHAVGISNKVEELELYGGVLVLRTEGEAFCGPDIHTKKARELGLRVYRRFLEVANRIPTTYGAILVEYSLEEPHELRRDPRSLAFRNFFLSRERLGDGVVAEVIRLAGEDTYVEHTGTGVYISMDTDFNPAGRGNSPNEVDGTRARIPAVVGRAAP